MGTGARAETLRPGDRRPPRFHGLFVPGGMFNLPGTTTSSGRVIRDDEDPRHDPRAARWGDQTAAWTERVRFQRELIRGTRDRGTPTLGVCGGSRCMAQVALRRGEGEGSTYLLPEHEAQLDLEESRGRPRPRKVHNFSFREPWSSAHEMRVDPDSALGRIMRGEHWRDRGQPLLTRLPGGGVPRDADPALYADPEPSRGPLRVRTNSMHWAASRFDPPRDGPSPVRVSATEPRTGVVEAWERTDHPFFIGDQSHPEFAQIPAGDFDRPTALRHRRVMAALGQAAAEDLAIDVMRGNRRFMSGFRAAIGRARERIAARRLEDTAFSVVGSLFDGRGGTTRMSREEFDRMRS